MTIIITIIILQNIKITIVIYLVWLNIFAFKCLHSNALFCNWNGIIIWFFAEKWQMFTPDNHLESNTHVSSTSHMIWGIIHICSTNAAGVTHQSSSNSEAHLLFEAGSRQSVRTTGQRFVLLVVSSSWDEPSGRRVLWSILLVVLHLWPWDCSFGAAFGHNHWNWREGPHCPTGFPIPHSVPERDRKMWRERERVREEGRIWGDGGSFHSHASAL